MLLSKNKLIVAAALCGCLQISAQKKPLDHSVYDSWKSIANMQVSKQGNIISYEIQPQEGDGQLVLERRKSDRKINIDRAFNAVITPDENYAICLIKPFFQDTRKAKIKKWKDDKMPKDSLAIVQLQTGKIVKFPNVLSYRIGDENSFVIAFLSADTALISKADRKRQKIGKPLLVYQLKTGKTDTIPYVEEYCFDKSGSSLAFTVRDTTKQYSARLLTTQNAKTTTLTEHTSFVSLPQFSVDGSQMLFLTSADSTSSGTKNCALYLYRTGDNQPQLLIGTENHKNMPAGWALNQYAEPYFSRDGKQIFAGIAPIIPPNDTTLVSFETAGLDIWNYADAELPPMQLKNLKKDIKATCIAVYRPATQDLLPLTTSFYDRIKFVNEANANYFLSVDDTKSIIETQWKEQTASELSLVSLTNGKRTAIAQGVFSFVTPSPNGKFVAWFNLSDSQWYLYDVASATTRCLTDHLNIHFWDEDNDRPQAPDAYGIAGWTKDDQALLVYDRFDIWQLPTNGSQAVNLTAGKGRKNNRIYRYIDTKDRADHYPVREKEQILPGQTLLLSIFDRTAKKNGFAELRYQPGKAISPSIRVLDGYTFSQIKKAENADLYVYQKANFNTSPDVHTNTSTWKSEKKLSDINPQMKDYSWGSAELVHWTAYDGTPLDGLLYKPEGFDPNKKYPMLIYFYELNSENLYRYYAPSPSRSIINISFYCSRGYLVFVPDIVYKSGLPGESAYNCIVSGAEALAKNTWVDARNMAIQGQSWGGYQVAYLVTRTNMFKAAEAGAPVSNMTSAYGGIRWGTGMSRQFQYEHTQSRIGRTLWEAPELYITNSPLFKADKVETPLLIMHNDADGSVPWYQGIEYFMALRRLGKPVWMLEYNNEDHNLTERRNMKDLSIRMQQYFDYYLKGDPMPAWMKSGIPAVRKGQYFGLENAQ